MIMTDADIIQSLGVAGLALILMFKIYMQTDKTLNRFIDSLDRLNERINTGFNEIKDEIRRLDR